MKYLTCILSIVILVGCSAAPKSNPEVWKNSNCEIPELSGEDCVEPNQKEISKNPFGKSGKNPIRADGPRGQRGQREYLSRLICPDGRAVTSFSRVGSVGIGPYGFMMDLYHVECGDKTYSVYIDMYHSNHVENKPVDGFTIKH